MESRKPCRQCGGEKEPGAGRAYCLRCMPILDEAEYMRIWRKRNPDKVRAGRQRWGRKWMLRKYGITPEEYAARLEDQGGVCAICNGAENKWKRDASLAVDHCHASGSVRGILCDRCNLMIGYAEDAPDLLRKAVSYLESSDTTAL